MKRANLLKKIRDELAKDERIIFAYVYGSFIREIKNRDIDIAIFVKRGIDEFEVCGELQIRLSKIIGIPPDLIDIRTLNALESPVLLKNILNGKLIVNKNNSLYVNFIENFSLNYRESEGIIAEAFS
jgi:predicted nucleotidyltransferase